MTFILEKLIDSSLLFNRVKNICGQSNNYIQWLIQEMRFDSELKLSNVLSGDTFIVELEQLFTDDEWINLIELNWENHLTVSEKFLQHFCVAIFEAIEQDFNLFKYIFFWFRWINPFCKLIKQLLLEYFSVFFSS